MDDLISRKAAIDSIRKIKANYCETADDQILLIDKAMAMTELMMLSSAQPDLEDIKNQALNCSAELLKLVALIGRHNKEDEP